MTREAGSEEGREGRSEPGLAEAEALLETAVEAAREAGAYVKGMLGRAKQLETKSSTVDLVTEVDIESGRRIVRALRGRYPDHKLVVEEPAMIDGVDDGTSDISWIVDPIDGTTSFVHTFPCFSISIAARRDGPNGSQQLLAAVVYNPALEELFAAATGRGATLNGEPVRVTKTPDIAHALLGTGFPYDRGLTLRRQLAILAEIMKTAHDIRRTGSAAYDLCMVACGRTDGYWELAMKPWDLSAGTLILREAGGRMTNLEGQEWVSPEPDVVASNGVLHEELLETVVRGEAAGVERLY